jgi:WD40 repeat protein
MYQGRVALTGLEMIPHNSVKLKAGIGLILFILISCSMPTGLGREVPPASPTPSSQPLASDLAFVSDRRQRGNLDIWLFSSTTGQAEPLTADDWQDAEPTWSPAGQVVAFLSFEIGGPAFIRTVNLSDKSVRVVWPPEQFVSVENIAWSRDGSRLFCIVYNGQTRDRSVWQVDLKTGTRQLIAQAEGPLSVSADDKYLGTGIRRAQDNVLVFQVIRLSDNAILRPQEDIFPFELDWAPQGNALAVAAVNADLIHGAPGGVRLATWAVNGEAVDPQAVSLLPQAEPPQRYLLCDLSWSPDGKKIMAVRALLLVNGCLGDVLLYDADLAHYELLPLERQARYPRWSSDGRWIIYSKDDTLQVLQYQSQVQNQADGEIWIADQRGENNRPLLQGPYYNGQPAWRP